MWAPRSPGDLLRVVKHDDAIAQLLRPAISPLAKSPKADAAGSELVSASPFLLPRSACPGFAPAFRISQTLDLHKMRGSQARMLLLPLGSYDICRCLDPFQART